jgi:hypothetical protein
MTAPSGTRAPRRGTRRLAAPAGAAALALAAAVALTLTEDGASPVPTAVQVQAVHRALHDIDAQCPGAGKDPVDAQSRVQGDVETIVAFAQRYPDAAFPFPIDQETGRTQSLLLVARQAMRTCAPALASRLNLALPQRLRDTVRNGT